MGFYHNIYPSLLILIKEIFQLHSKSIPKRALAHALTISAIVCLFSSFLTFYIFAKFVTLLLMIYHGDRFVGLLYSESIYEVSDPTYTYISSIYLLRHDGDVDEINRELYSICWKLYASNRRFSSVVKRFLGYYYFVESSSIEMLGRVEYDKDTLSREELLQFLSNRYRIAHASHRNNDLLWKMEILQKPVMWNGDSNKYYCVMIRTSHCIADAVCLSVFHQKYLLNNVVDDQFKNALVKGNKPLSSYNSINIHNTILSGVKIDSTELYNLGCKGNLVFRVEKDNASFMKVKRLKKHFNCSFSDIFTAAAYGSLTHYYDREGLTPDGYLCGYTCRPIGENIKAVLDGKVLQNQASLSPVLLPFALNQNMSDNFKLMEKQLQSSSSSFDKQVIYLIYKLGGYLPPRTLSAILNFCTLGCSMGITNVPSPDCCKMGKFDVADSFCFVNGFSNTKFIMVVTTYGGRLQTALVSTNDVKTSKLEMEFILKRTFENIDKLWDETFKC